MKRAALLFLLCGCADRNVDRYIEERIPAAPGSDPSVADERLVGMCMRGGAGQVLGKIVAVENDPRTAGPAYLVKSGTSPEPVRIPASQDIPDRVSPCS